MIREEFRNIQVGPYINIDIKFGKTKNIINYMTNPVIENSSILLLDIYKHILYENNEFQKELFKHDAIKNPFKDMSKTEKDIYYHNAMLERCKKLKKSDFDGSLYSFIYLEYLAKVILKRCADLNIESELINILNETLVECVAKIYTNIRTSLISSREALFKVPLQNCIIGSNNDTVRFDYSTLVLQFLNLVKYIDYSKGAY